MANKTVSAKNKSENPVGRPRKKVGIETLMDNKKSFKLNNNNVVFDKLGDPLVLAAIIFFMACICLAYIYFNK